MIPVVSAVTSYVWLAIVLTKFGLGRYRNNNHLSEIDAYSTPQPSGIYAVCRYPDGPVTFVRPVLAFILTSLLVGRLPGLGLSLRYIGWSPQTRYPFSATPLSRLDSTANSHKYQTLHGHPIRTSRRTNNIMISALLFTLAGAVPLASAHIGAYSLIFSDSRQ